MDAIFYQKLMVISLCVNLQALGIFSAGDPPSNVSTVYTVFPWSDYAAAG